jgi:hypothetical protein
MICKADNGIKKFFNLLSHSPNIAAFSASTWIKAKFQEKISKTVAKLKAAAFGAYDLGDYPHQK